MPGIPQLITAGGGPFNSGAPSTGVTNATDIPVGSCVLIALNVSGGSYDKFTIITDAVGNVYQSIQAPSGSYQGNAIGVCLATAHDMPNGTTWTVTTQGGSQYAVKGVYTIGAVNTLIASTTIANAVAGTSLSATVGPYTPPLTSLIAFGFVNGTFGTWTEGAGFTNLTLGSGFNSISYEIQIANGANITWAPSWTSSTIYSGALIALGFGVVPLSVPLLFT